MRYILLFTLSIVLFSSCLSGSNSCIGLSGRSTADGDGSRSAAGADDRLTVKEMLSAGPSATVPTSEEKKLYDLVIAYRKQKGLPSIPWSKSLSFVARIHVRDLAFHDWKEPCNAHSWSSDGPWTGGCYTPDHKAAKVMWDKPRELTLYKGSGYEIARGAWYAKGYLGAADSLEGWKSSPGHHAVIINDGVWKKTEWKAIGTGIYRNFACIWFGTEEDPEQ
ncbi:MAG: hypothetical protein JW904_15400 [Spirochaetales bacterium]|nr:hypothetical protein [Spirochaetales bacterium]